MKWTFAVVILLAMLVPPRVEAEGSGTDDETASLVQCAGWTRYYYKSPAPKRLPAALACVARSSKVEDAATMVPQMYFHAAATKRGKGVLEAYFDHFAPLPPVAQGVAVRLFWLSENPAAPKMLARAKAEWKAELPQSLVKWAEKKPRPKPLLESTIRTATDLDTRWSVFFATGDGAYVRQIAGILDRQAVGLSGQTLIMAAELSLRTNAKHHEPVAETLRSMIAKREGEAAERLRALLR